MDQFASFIRSKVSIDEDELEFILSKFKNRTLEKGQLLLRKGQIVDTYFYLNRGALRFYLEESAEQNTALVVFQNDFFTEISSLYAQIPTRFNVEAVEKSELFYISRVEMENLYKQFPHWQEFGRRVWEEMAVKMVSQIINFQTLSAEKRYLESMKIPDIVEKVPVKQMASMLGITPNALSRIRKKIR